MSSSSTVKWICLESGAPFPERKDNNGSSKDYTILDTIKTHFSVWVPLVYKTL